MQWLGGRKGGGLFRWQRIRHVVCLQGWVATRALEGLWPEFGLRTTVSLSVHSWPATSAGLGRGQVRIGRCVNWPGLRGGDFLCYKK
jgi:hypothetical protein